MTKIDAVRVEVVLKSAGGSASGVAESPVAASCHQGDVDRMAADLVGLSLAQARTRVVYHPHNLVLCGPHGCGKDEAARIIGRLSGLRYGGSLSWVGLPVVASALGITEQEAWDTRHRRHADWTRILDSYRLNDQTRLARDALARGHMIIGCRSVLELRAVREARLAQAAVWINRPGVPPDPTMTYGPEECDTVLENDGGLPLLEANVKDLLYKLGIPVK